MSSKTKRQQKQNARAKDGSAIISKLLDNKQFIENYGQYIRIGESIIYPKYQDIVYQKRETLNIKEMISEHVEYLLERFDKKALPNGDSLYFIVPLSAVIALPSGYKANHVMLKNKTATRLLKVLSVTLTNGAEVHKAATDNEPGVFYGLSFALIGVQTNAKITDSQYMDYYLECVAYLNNFITAWKLFRHDHTVKNVTPRTLPEAVEYYHLKHGYRKSRQDMMRVHSNDLADLWSKRLPESPDSIEDDIMRLCEYLPTNPLAHYVLRIGERATTNFCLAEYEDCVINGDRYAELALRDILRHELNLSDEELGEYKTLYSTNPRTKAVVQTLARHLHITGDATIPNWYNRSRDVRNKITHQLDITSITPNVAIDALRHNFAIVDLMAKKANCEFEWYSMMNDNFYKLFEGPIQ